MKIKVSKGEKIFNILNIIFMILLMIVMMYPFLHVAFASVSDSNQLIQHNGFLLKPVGFTLSAYKSVFENKLILSGYINTLINFILAVSLNIILTTLGAYALSRKDFLLRNHIMMLITFTMFFNGGLIPNYLLLKNLGLTNTRYALIIPTAISAYNLIIMRTSFQNIPESLFESAKLDGANDFTILTKIVVPLSMPVIAVMLLFYGVQNWNSWFPAFIYLKDRALWPLQLVLREIVIANNLDEMITGADVSDKEAVGESIKYATIMVATLPILLIYPFLQKYFVKGVMIGAVKG
ncbi:carbohydrate ABC transporter permease [Clostridium sediminicola]|uniref:carbohydrate ABC transporter permease n=1 Tax=Clostridium sediminicola TaxID=3114879 RepID=UPI0031F27BC7